MLIITKYKLILFAICTFHYPLTGEWVPVALVKIYLAETHAGASKCQCGDGT
jgi:hypothetical protein